MQGDRAEGGEAAEPGVVEAMADAPDVTAGEPPVAEAAAVPEAEAPKKGRRRPKARTAPVESAVAEPVVEVAPEAPEAVVADVAETAPAKPKRARRAKAVPAAESDAVPETIIAEPEAVTPEAPGEEGPVEKARPKRRAPRRKAGAPVVEAPVGEAAEEADASAIAFGNGLDGAAPADDMAADGAIDSDPGEAGSPRRGWWQRTFGA
jgi:ribonuclease E